MPRPWTLPLLLLPIVPAFGQERSHDRLADTLPRPQRLVHDGTGSVRGHAVDVAPGGPRETALAFLAGLTRLGVRDASLVEGEGCVHFALDPDLGPEVVRVRTEEGVLQVTAGDVPGAARGAALLLQLVEVDEGEATWPALELDDRPEHPYRSMLVDLGRNPHSPATLRQVVDVLWLLGGNLLHLHLIDDQLCSWPSEVFPKLADPRAGWTLDDWRALEAHAHARGVTLMPEIEVPGHSSLLRQHYPEVFGETPTDLATRPEAREGIERLLEEVLAVFPRTPYVHVGGDEAYSVPQDAQRDLINHLDDFLRARGRRTVVWEGPARGEGENAVHPEVLHVCWQALAFTAQDMLDAGHEVVHAAWDPLYVVDHYPRTMFTAVDLERAYAWDPRRFGHVDPGLPTFAEPHVTRSAEGIRGFCLCWWEGRESNLLDLCVPRLAAVCAAARNRAGEDDFEDFLARYQRLLPRIETLAGFTLASTPFADPATQTRNLAYRARVVPSHGSHNPPFGPERLTNGIPDRFDTFLGFPCTPEPLTIDLVLREPARVGRVVVHERAVGRSHEVYELLVSADGTTFEPVGHSGEGTRGEASFVVHAFDPRPVAAIRIVTHGCHGLTFPSFSRLCEVEAFGPEE